MIWINLKLKLLLAAVVVAAVNADDKIYYDVGYGNGQWEYEFPANLPYINFYTLSETDAMVKLVTIHGRFKDMKREDGNFYFSLRLQQKAAESEMTYALYVKTNRRSEDNCNSEKMMSNCIKKSTGYLYTIFNDPKSSLYRKTVDTTAYTINNASFTVGKEFTLSIYLQTSHILFSLENGDDGKDNYVWKQYYGYFFTEQKRWSHQNIFSDRIFDTIHIEGDVAITEIEVISRDEFTKLSSEMSTDRRIYFKPYAKKYLELNAFWDGMSRKYLFYSESIENLYIKPNEEGEIILRGNIGDTEEKVEFLFLDVSYPRYPCNISTITYDPTVKETKTNKHLRITGSNGIGKYCGEYYSPLDTEKGLEQYEKYGAFHKINSHSPFKKKSFFEISVRKLSYTDKNAEKKRNLQITIRVKSRIYTWYIGAHRDKEIHALKVFGKFSMKEVAIIF